MKYSPILMAAVVAAASAVGSLAPRGASAQTPNGTKRKVPAPIVLKMRGSRVLVNSRVSSPPAKPRQNRKQPAGWQPGGPLRPIYQSAVKAVHTFQFDRAVELCRQGLSLSKGDKAFTDLMRQIPDRRRDATQGKLSRIYSEAVALTRKGLFNDAEELCREGLEIESGNALFTALLQDIASRRNATLQHRLLVCYQEASTLLSQGLYREAEAKCQQGLRLQPNDAVLRSLLRRIHERTRLAGG